MAPSAPQPQPQPQQQQQQQAPRSGLARRSHPRHLVPTRPAPARPPTPQTAPLLTRRSLLLANTASILTLSPWWRVGSNSAAAATTTIADPGATVAAVAVAVPRGASAADALREALVGRGLDSVALVLEPGATYEGGGLVVDRESRPYGAPPPRVHVLVGGGSGGGGGGGSASGPGTAAATLRVETKSPYARVLEVRGDGVCLRAENLRIVHASKSVASNYAVLASAGSELELDGCDVTSATGAGVAADGAARCVLTACALSGCARQGLAAFGGSRDTSRQGPAAVRLRDCAVERNGGDGALVRDGAALYLEGACVFAGNKGAGVRWFVVEEREAEAALAAAAAAAAGSAAASGDGLLIAPGVRFARSNARGAIVVDTGGGAGDERAAAALAAALGRGGAVEGGGGGGGGALAIEVA